MTLSTSWFIKKVASAVVNEVWPLVVIAALSVVERRDTDACTSNLLPRHFDLAAGGSFLPASAYRYAVQTISSPRFRGARHVVVEGSGLVKPAFPADWLHPKDCHCLAASTPGFSAIPAYSLVQTRITPG